LRRVDDFRRVDAFLADAFLGTLAPAFRASDKPIAIACFRLFTFFRERPARSVPVFRSCIAFLTFEAAFFPYRRAIEPPATLSANPRLGGLSPDGPQTLVMRLADRKEHAGCCALRRA
jgi:hypothetical protein